MWCMCVLSRQANGKIAMYSKELNCLITPHGPHDWILNTQKQYHKLYTYQIYSSCDDWTASRPRLLWLLQIPQWAHQGQFQHQQQLQLRESISNTFTTPVSLLIITNMATYMYLNWSDRLHTCIPCHMCIDVTCNIKYHISSSSLQPPPPPPHPFQKPYRFLDIILQKHS